MKITENDKYINCDDLKQQANNLYNILSVNKNKLNKLDIYYIDDMNKYLNNWDVYKEHQIKQYIKDLQEYIKVN